MLIFISHGAPARGQIEQLFASSWDFNRVGETFTRDGAFYEFPGCVQWHHAKSLSYERERGRVSQLPWPKAITAMRGASAVTGQNTTLVPRPTACWTTQPSRELQVLTGVCPTVGRSPSAVEPGLCCAVEQSDFPASCPLLRKHAR